MEIKKDFSTCRTLQHNIYQSIITIFFILPSTYETTPKQKTKTNELFTFEKCPNNGLIENVRVHE